MNNSIPVISLRKADILNGEEIVIFNLNMDIHPADLVYIVGKVGTGKTSIIRTITAENPLAGGEGDVCGFKLKDIREKEIPYLRRKLGIVFQDFQLLMDRPVAENLEFVLRATGWKSQNEIDRRITAVLKAVGMETKAHKMPHKLSGGEQQRVAIARALLNSPDVIIADDRQPRPRNRRRHPAAALTHQQRERHRHNDGYAQSCHLQKISWPHLRLQG